MRVQTCAGHDAVSVSRALGRGGRFECGHAYIRAADVPYQWRLMRLSTTSIGEMSRGRLTTPNPSPRIVTARGPAASGAAFFFGVSEQADGDRRRTPWPIWRYLKTPHLAGTSPMLPSDSVQPSAFAVGMPRSVLARNRALHWHRWRRCRRRRSPPKKK